MKTISTITLLALLFTFSCTQKEETETPPSMETEDSFSTREVMEDSALNLMGAYQLWRTMNPDSVRWDSTTNTLYFDKITFDPNEDALIISKIKEITAVYAEATKQKNDADMKFPLTKKEEQALSFYIDKRDIDSINSLTDTTFSGYRAYLAMEPYSNASNPRGLTHLLLGPAEYKNERFSDVTLKNEQGKTILLDLILPCPNGCPNNTTPNYIKDFHPGGNTQNR